VGGLVVYPQISQSFFASRERWTQIRQPTDVRFVVGGGLHFATAAAALGTLLCVAFLAHSAIAEGKALDFTWFQWAGRSGAPAMPVLATFRAILPVAFAFPALVWLYTWALTSPSDGNQEPSSDEPWKLPAHEDDTLPLRKYAEALAFVGAGVLLCLVFYTLFAMAFANWRRAPQFEMALDALVIAGALSCFVALLLDRIGRVLKLIARPID
jgi:hypothetical protein